MKRNSVCLLLLLLCIPLLLTGCYRKDDTASRYAAAVEAFNDGNYERAASLFNRIGLYEDSINYTRYINASRALDANEPERAYNIFSSMRGFLDCGERADAIAAAHPGLLTGMAPQLERADTPTPPADTPTAAPTETPLPPADTPEPFVTAVPAESALPPGPLDEALRSAEAELQNGWRYDLFGTFGALLDSDENSAHAREEVYLMAEGAMRRGDFNSAYCLFTLLSERQYGNSRARAQDARLEYARGLIRQGRTAEARELLVMLPDHPAAAALLESLPSE